MKKFKISYGKKIYIVNAKDAGSSAEKMAQYEYDDLKNQLNSLQKQYDEAENNPDVQVQISAKIDKVSKDIAGLKKVFGYAIEDNCINDSIDSIKLREGQRVNCFGEECIISDIHHVPTISGGQLVVEFKTTDGSVYGRYGYDDVVMFVERGKIKLLDSAKVYAPIVDATRASLIEKLRTVSVPYGERYQVTDGAGWSFDLQHHGMSTYEEVTKYPRVSPKESSLATLRFWYNGTFMAKFEGPINNVKADGIAYLKTHLKDSDKDAAQKVADALADADPWAIKTALWSPTEHSFLHKLSSIPDRIMYTPKASQAMIFTSGIVAQGVRDKLNAELKKLGHAGDFAIKTINENDLKDSNEKILIKEYRRVRGGNVSMGQLIKHDRGYTFVSSNPKEDKDMNSLSDIVEYIKSLGFKEI